jgi:hypothetical protein
MSVAGSLPRREVDDDKLGPARMQTSQHMRELIDMAQKLFVTGARTSRRFLSAETCKTLAPTAKQIEGGSIAVLLFSMHLIN